MSATVTIGIVAHIARQAQAQALAERVDATHVCVDDGSLGCEGNHYRTWDLLKRAPTPWAVVLEDDAVPVRDFAAQLDGVLAYAPTPLVSLYLGRSRPPAWQNWIRQATLRADHADACYIESRRLLHGVGVAMHTGLIGAMLRQTRHLDRGTPVDEAITLWARHQRPPLTVSYCWPSIVDHLDGPTLVAHRDGKPRATARKAWAVGSRNRWHATLVPK
jgi:hypothetical protein